MIRNRIFSWKSPDVHVIAEDVCHALVSEFDQFQKGKLKPESFSRAVILCLFYIGIRNDETIFTKGTYESFKTAFQIGSAKRLFSPSKEEVAAIKAALDFNKSFLDEHAETLASISMILEKIQNEMYTDGILSDTWICDNIGAILEVWLSNFSHESTSAFTFQPRSVTELIIDLAIELHPEWRLLDVNKDKPLRVFNPFAGLSSYPVSVANKIKHIDFTSQEIDEDTYYLSIIRLFCNRLKIFHLPALDENGARTQLYVPNTENHLVLNPKYKRFGPTENLVQLANSLKEWPKEKFDFIVCSPPLHTKHDLYEDSTAPEFILRKGFQALEKGGLLALLLPSNSEYINLDRTFRVDAIQSGYLKHVLRLPNRTLKGTSISLTAYIFKKTKSGNIQFTDISDELFHFKDSRGQIQFRNDLVKKSIEINEDLVSKSVSSSIVEKENYTLTPLRYIIEDSLPEAGISTQHVVLKQILSDKKETKAEKGNVLDKQSIYLTDGTIRKIKEFYIDRESFERIGDEFGSSQKKSWRKITTSSVLITSRGNIVARFIDDHVLGSIDLYVEPSIRPYDFTPGNIEIELDYLLWKLNSPNFQNRKRKYEYGYAVPLISARDFLEMKIDVPPIQFQIDQIKELAETSKVFQASIDAANRNLELLQKSTYSVFSDFAHFNHSIISPKFLTISSIVHNLSDLLKAEGQEFTQIRKELGDSSIEQNLQKIKDYLADVGKMLAALSKSTTLLDVSLSPVSLKDIVEHIQERVSFSTDRFPSIVKELPIEFTSSDFDKEEFDGLKISTNLTLITTLCENIFKNAHDHAFPNDAMEYPERMVVLNLDYSTEFLYLTLMNNGIPFENEIERSEFISAGRTSKKKTNTGLGGFDVDRIASYLGDPNWELITDIENEFPVQFKFKFPMIKNL